MFVSTHRNLIATKIKCKLCRYPNKRRCESEATNITAWPHGYQHETCSLQAWTDGRQGPCGLFWSTSEARRGIGKSPKIQTPKIIGLIVSKFKLHVYVCGFTIRVTCPNDTDGFANSVDPEQSDLGLHCLSRPVCLKT